MFEISCPAPPCDLVIVDNIPNSNAFVIQQTGLPEAMYVDGDVMVANGVEAEPGSRIVYYNGDFIGQEQVPGPFRHVLEKTLFGDWNNDCQITTKELQSLRRIINGTDPYDPLFDLDCDGQVLVDPEFNRFQFNLQNQDQLLPPLCGTGLGLTETLTAAETSELGAWVIDLTPEAELPEFAARIQDVADANPSTPFANDLGALVATIGD